MRYFVKRHPLSGDVEWMVSAEDQEECERALDHGAEEVSKQAYLDAVDEAFDFEGEDDDD